MSLLTQLRSFRSLRRSLQFLERIAVAEERQATALERLVARLDPEPPAEPDPADLKVRTGVSYHPDDEAAKIQAFVEQCWKDVRREPTDEEICRFLDGEDVRLGATP